MAVFKCENCGHTEVTRCKPKTCKECGKEGTMAKQA